MFAGQLVTNSGIIQRALCFRKLSQMGQSGERLEAKV